MAADRTNAERQRRYARRQRQGVMPLQVECPADPLTTRLVEIGALRPELADDRRAVERALNEVLAAWVAP